MEILLQQFLSSHLPGCCKSNLRQFSSFPAHAKTQKQKEKRQQKTAKHIQIVTKSLAVHKQNKFIIICIVKLIA